MKHLSAELKQAKQETMGQRLRIIRAYYGKSQTEFANEYESSQSVWSKYELDQAYPPANIIKKICDLGWPPEWLLNGKTNDKHAEKHAPANQEIIKINRLLAPLSTDEIHFFRQCIESYLELKKKT